MRLMLHIAAVVRNDARCTVTLLRTLRLRCLLFYYTILRYFVPPHLLPPVLLRVTDCLTTLVHFICTFVGVDVDALHCRPRSLPSICYFADQHDVYRCVIDTYCVALLHTLPRCGDRLPSHVIVTLHVALLRHIYAIVVRVTFAFVATRYVAIVVVPIDTHRFDLRTFCSTHTHTTACSHTFIPGIPRYVTATLKVHRALPARVAAAIY